MAPAAAMAKTRTNSTDWQTWFASPDAAAANQTLASTKAIAAKGAATAKLGAKTESELLGGLARRRRRLLLNSKGVEDLYAALEGATLDDLREYVAEHATVNVVEASEQWNRKRNVGWRRARTGFQRFAMSFDRFLSGFQGVVEIVKMADGQYGGMATQVLSILFAVGLPQLPWSMYVLVLIRRCRPSKSRPLTTKPSSGPWKPSATACLRSPSMARSTPTPSSATCWRRPTKRLSSSPCRRRSTSSSADTVSLLRFHISPFVPRL